MTFPTVVTQLRNCLGSAASVFPGGTADISVADERIYSRGKATVAIIDVNPTLQHVRASFGGGHQHIWGISVTVGTKWNDAVNGPLNNMAAWQGVMDQICKYPNLGLGGGGAIYEAHVQNARLEPIVEEYGTVKFANVQLTVSITEDVTIAEQE